MLTAGHAPVFQDGGPSEQDAEGKPWATHQRVAQMGAWLNLPNQQSFRSVQTFPVPGVLFAT